MKFANGETAEADIVIAADGIHSILQKYVVEPKPPEYSGCSRLSGLDSSRKTSRLATGGPAGLDGDGKHFMVYPVRSGRLLNYVGFVPSKNAATESWSAIGDRDELRRPSTDGILAS